MLPVWRKFKLKIVLKRNDDILILLKFDYQSMELQKKTISPARDIIEVPKFIEK